MACGRQAFYTGAGLSAKAASRMPVDGVAQVAVAKVVLVRLLWLRPLWQGSLLSVDPP